MASRKAICGVRVRAPRLGYFIHLAREWLLARADLPPRQAGVGRAEIARAGVGACLGIVAAALLSTWAIGASTAAPLLMPPLGASAVLLFSEPGSRFARPYSIVAGNLLAAVIGVTCAKLVPLAIPAAGLAVGITATAVMACRCIHPPSGGVALVAVLGGPHVAALGYRFVAAPVLLNTVLLLAAAVAYNNATGRDYPDRARRPL